MGGKKILYLITKQPVSSYYSFLAYLEVYEIAMDSLVEASATADQWRTLLKWCIRSRKLLSVEFLLDSNRSGEAASFDGCVALRIAAAIGDLPIAHRLMYEVRGGAPGGAPPPPPPDKAYTEQA